jgi:DDE superfamily endonuclease
VIGNPGISDRIRSEQVIGFDRNPQLADFAAENKAWLRVYRLPAYTPDLNPAEGIWSLLKRSMANFAAADLDGLVRIVKRKLKKIQYRPHLLDGCLAATGLTIEPW